jgi:hypothetical protein
VDAGDATGRLGELLALAAGDLAPLREAIGTRICEPT